MPQAPIESKLIRLLFEILVVVGLSEAVVMLVLPEMAPHASETLGAALDVGLLTLLSAPLLLWRFTRLNGTPALPRPSWHGDPRRGIQSLTWTLLAFAIGMAITGGATLWAYKKEHADGQERFEHHAEKLAIELDAHFNQPLDGLNAIAGLYAADSKVERHRFHSFWNAMDIPGVFPGVRSFGVIESVPRTALGRFVARLQSEDDRQFSIHGAGQESPLYVVRHTASNANNQSVVGLDIGAEPVRRRAIEAALQRRQAVLSDTIALVPLNGVADKGVIYFRPIYQADTNGTQSPAGSARLLTIAYASIVLNDLVSKVLPVAAGNSEFELLDLQTPGAATVLFDSRLQPGRSAAANDAVPHNPRFTSSTDLLIHGHRFRLRAYSSAEFEAGRGALRPVRVGSALLLLTLFVSLSIWLLTRGRDHALQQSQRIASENQRLAKALQRTNNSVLITNENNEIVWANDAFSKISGFSLAQALGRKPSALRNTEVADPEALQRVRSALSRGEDVRTQMRSHAADGSDYWLDMDIQVLHTETGQYAGFVAVETDITAERRAAQKLRSALQKSRALMSTVDAHAIVSETDSRGTITHVNDGFVRISAYPRDALTGSNHSIVNSGLHPKEFWIDMWTTIAAGQPWHGQICNRNKHGALYWVDSMIAPFIGDDGKIEKYVAIRIDITAQKQAQEKLLTSTKLLEASQRIARVGGWELNLENGQLFWTAEMFRILETTPEAFSPSMPALAQLLTPESRQSMNAALALATEQGQGFDLELHADTAQGKRIDIRMTCVATQVQGKTSLLTGILQDITDNKQYEKSLEEARTRAELATQTKGQFLANMSHEIRTPMNAIRGMAMLLQKTSLNAQQFDYASKIDHASRSLLSLINDILDFSKVEAGKMVLDLQPFRLDKLLRDLSVILSSNVGTKALDLVFDIDPQLPPVLLGDSMRLQQVLTNLGGNAIKFTAAGQVLISVRMKQRLQQQVRIEFAVQDSGIGIASEHLQRIFDGFSQAESSTTRKFGGTGLGLSISKRLVELMGGTLQVQSAPGQGSTFSFSIELGSSEDAPAAPGAQHGADTPLRRVLVVDDNPIAGNSMAQMTRFWGWSTELASSGEEALQCLQGRGPGHAFDTIYLDWQMPGMDGWQSAEQIRRWYQQEQLPQPVIVMVSGNGRDTLEQRTPEEQKLLDGFLVKPVTASMLQEATLALSTSEFRLRKRDRSSARQLEGMRILVVEDNLLNQQVAEELLNSEGAQVALAANGRQGVNAVASANPQFDAVLMDIQMPVMDGFAATRAIREQLGLRELPIIAMTANAMASDREECLAAGMNEHVGKPFDLSELVQTLLLHSRYVPRRSRAGSSSGGIASAASTASASATAPDRTSARSALPEVAGLDLRGALARMSGMQSLYLRSAQEFLSMLNPCVADYRRHCATAPQQARMQMHTLKSTARLLGATELADLASRIELVCKGSGAALQAEPQATELEQAIARTRPLLQSAIMLLSPTPSSPAAAGQTAQRQDLQQLASLLRAGDLQALEVFARIRASLEGLPPATLELLEQALQDLDLDNAQIHCQDLLATV